MKEKTQIISLLGKDYLNVAEAAFYCGVSEVQFRKKLSNDPEWIDVPVLKIMGKKVYRLSDIRRKIEILNRSVDLRKVI